MLRKISLVFALLGAFALPSAALAGVPVSNTQPAQQSASTSVLSSIGIAEMNESHARVAAL